MTYLTSNFAATRVDHTFPELHPLFVPSDTSDADKIRASVLMAMRALGWEEIRESDKETRAVIVTPFLRFRDGVTVRLEETRDGMLIQAHSVSRVGIGDLAANARHIRLFFAELDVESTEAGH